MTTIKIKKQINDKEIKITISNKNKTPLKLKLIKKYGTKLLSRYNISSDKNTYIRALSNLGFTTLKSLNETIDNMYDNEEEYFADRVQDDTKFVEFYEIQYVLFKK